ncbi:RNase H domain-containing protein [Trichonephila clavipes]|nr:RNase H domain-containing protein [Trichonephila clavipes]
MTVVPGIVLDIPPYTIITHLVKRRHRSSRFVRFIRVVEQKKETESCDAEAVSCCKTCVSKVWILTDSRSSIQHLSNWPPIGDSTSRSILQLFQQLSDQHPIHLQWVPSNVGLLGNEVADDLAKAANSNPVDPEDHMVLTSTEIYSRAKELICRTWAMFNNCRGAWSIYTSDSIVLAVMNLLNRKALLINEKESLPALTCCPSQKFSASSEPYEFVFQ